MTTSKPLDYSYEFPSSLSSVAPITENPTGDSTWMDRAAEAGGYNVRGKTYLDDGVKIPSRVSAMEIIGMHYTFSRNPIANIAMHPSSIVQEQHVGRDDRPFLFITNFLIPNVGNWVTYFARRRGEAIDAVFEKMLLAFIEGDDEYRNQRLKIIPGIGPEGNWIVRTAVGNKPAILGTKLTTKYYRGDNYFEVEVDVGSSTVAMGLLNLVAGYCSSLDLEIAFLLESKSPAELPERILGGVRAHRPALTPPWWNES